LVSVCVVGRGASGEEAALEAGIRGADVTIVESRPSPAAPWRSWPELIHGSPAEGFRTWRSSWTPKVLNEEASAAGPGFVTLRRGHRLRFDAVVIATGIRFKPPTFPGARKPGVFVLDCQEKYEELGRACASLDVAVVTGEGYRGLEVADRLSSLGVKVHLVISCWQREPPSPVVLAVIEDVARERGTEIQRGDVSRAVGTGGVEAAVAMGSVVPCDAIVFAPPHLPNPVRAALDLGQAGGIEVDRGMRASEPHVFAAGGCAELKGRSPGSGTLNAEPSLSGRIAGSNCTGSARSIGATRAEEMGVFGLRWSRVGIRRGPFPAVGTQAATVSRRWGPDSACSITHQRLSERVLRMESIEPASHPPAGLPPVGASVTLEEMALG